MKGLTPANVWLTIVLAGVVTFATRLSFIALLERIRVPVWFQRALRFVPAAVLSAIIVPETVTRNGAMDLSLHNPQIWAGCVAVAVAWKTKNVLLTILAGMVTLLLMTALL
jgi:branched-subunit amino acid transport protein